jgi:fatty acid desaturase
MEQAHKNRPVEWPTVGLIALTYAVLVTLVWFHASLPWWVILPIGAYFAALHSSLQHEVLHDHPTRMRWLNELLVFPSPTLWLPYDRYRDTHLAHHINDHLTDPERDPESFYMLPESWAALPPPMRQLYTFNHTLLGRMMIGPAVSVVRFWSTDFRGILGGDRGTATAWAKFALAVAMTISYVVWSGMPDWQYVAFVAYPGVSLALVRSYCEHQAAEAIDERTIIVEASPFWSLLFLNNNLHLAHHTRPGLAWYRLPAYYRAERERFLARNKGYVMRGYGEIFRRFFLKPKEPIPYPRMDWLRRVSAKAAVPEASP